MNNCVFWGVEAPHHMHVVGRDALELSRYESAPEALQRKLVAAYRPREGED